MRKLKHALVLAGLAISSIFYHRYADFDAPGHLPAPQASPVTQRMPDPLPSGSIPGIVLNPIIGASDDQVQLVTSAEALIQTTTDSECFHDFILKRALVMDQDSDNSTNGMTNMEVLLKIRLASGQIPVVVYHQPWWKPSSVAGYRNVGETTIHLRDTSLDSMCDTASLIAHEAIGHVIGGWDHDYEPTEERPFSVPYSINQGFTECCGK